MLQSIVVYTLLIVFMFYFTYKSNKGNGMIFRVIYLFPIIIYTIVFGFRYGVGIDYFNYLSIYEDWGRGIKSEEHLELAFAAIITFCSQLHFTPPIFFSIISFLQIIFIYLAFRSRKDVLAYSMLALFMTGVGLSGWNNVLRQVIACSILTYSLLFILDRKLIINILLIIFATLFHKSALIFLPISILMYINIGYFKNVKIQWCFFIISIFFAFVGLGEKLVVFFDKLIIILGYENYLDTDLLEMNYDWSIYSILLIFVQCIFIRFYNSVREYHEDKLFDLLYDLYFISICLGYVFKGSMMFGRILLYFSFFEFLIFGYYINYFIVTYKATYKNFFAYCFIWCYLILVYCYPVLYKAYERNIVYATYYQKGLYAKQERMQYDFLINR